MGNTISYDQKPYDLDLGNKGTIRGIQLDEKSRRYAGIPYALPPTGDNRWRKPRQLPADYAYEDGTGGPFDATEFKAVSPRRPSMSEKLREAPDNTARIASLSISGHP
uniref:Carboxylesterase type B domain-containing protein n=1 Tax=Bionectria ochroleuca TaxID=29856 RepID=A0A8H7TMW3_BIOOC